MKTYAEATQFLDGITDPAVASDIYDRYRGVIDQSTEDGLSAELFDRAVALKFATGGLTPEGLRFIAHFLFSTGIVVGIEMERQDCIESPKPFILDKVKQLVRHEPFNEAIAACLVVACSIAKAHGVSMTYLREEIRNIMKGTGK